MHKTKSGFTIIELLIVIVVIAILAAVTVVAYIGISVKARNTSRISYAQQTLKVLGVMKSVDGVDITTLLESSSNFGGSQGVCFSKGLPDVDADGKGDCATNTTPFSYAHETSSFITAVEKFARFPRPGDYPSINLGTPTVYAPMIILSIIDSAPGLTFIYYLEGDSQNCSVPGQLRYLGVSGYSTTNSNPYANSNGGVTSCAVKP